MEYFKFAIGLALVLAGAELFIKAVINLSSSSGRSRLFVGLTIVAFGTSAPELAIGILGVVDKTVGIGIGNVVGSNILNILFVLGLTALIRPIAVNYVTVKRELPILLGLSVFFSFIVFDGSIHIIEALLMATGLTGYLFYSWQISYVKNKTATKDRENLPKPSRGLKNLVLNILLVILSISLLGWGSHWTVQGAVDIAVSFGISELTIGLTLVAFGTSLPEIATSLSAIRKNEQDIAIGNVIGSCVFNLMIVPAVMAFVKMSPLMIDKDVVYIDMPIMILSIIVCLPVFFSQHKISRQEGFLFLLYYAVYVAVLYLRETTYLILQKHIYVIGILGVPMIITTLIAIFTRAVKFKNSIKQ